MKSLFKYFFICLILVIAVSSCKKDGTLVTAQSGTSGTLTSSASSLTLSKATQADTVVHFDWQLADFGYSAAVTQTIQFAKSGTNFADSIVVSLDPKQTTLAYAGLDFNALVSKLNLSFDAASNIDVRVKSIISTSVTPVYSNVVTMSVKPYAMTSWLYVPGAYENWELPSVDSLVSMTGNNVYVGIINFPTTGSEFKLLPIKDWATAYGDGGSGKLSTSGGNIASAGAGSYKITANLNALTINMAAFQYSVIGSSTPGGWDTDTDMKYNNGDSTWSVNINLTVGSIKFRLNHAWSDPTNYGGAGGVLSVNGSDIAVATAGTYKLVLDIPNLKYTLTKQ